MKVVHHKVFVEAVAYPVWAWGASARRERSRERIRENVQLFINEIGVDHIVSVIEHAPTVGRSSVVVWWYEKVAETDTQIIRASSENPNAQH